MSLEARITALAQAIGADIKALQSGGGGSLPLVRTPVNVAPAAGATSVPVTPTLTGNTFGSVYGVPQAASRWQIATTSDFASPVYDSGDLGGGFDPYSANVSLAARFDGTFADLTGKTITAFGNAAISTAQSKFGGGSVYFDGSGDYLQIADSADCNFGIGDFTIECFVNLSAMPTSDAWPSSWSSHMGVVCKGVPAAAPGFTLVLGQSDIKFNNRDTAVAVGPHGMTTGVWYHIAVTRSSGVVRTFVDGVVKGSSTGIATDYTYTQPLLIGTETAEGAWFNGYIDDLRITKGVARYTAAFTPPTTTIPPLATSGITHTPVGALTANTLHYWRCMYRDSDGVDSAWSTATSFTTGWPGD